MRELILLHTHTHIQNDSGGKVIIFGGEKNSYEHVASSEWLPRLSCLDLQMQNNCEV